MLTTIFTVSGRAGLFKKVTQKKNMLIVESLVDKRKLPLYTKDKTLSLGKISIYTHEGEAPLHEILTRIQNKEGGELIKIDLSAAKPDELRTYFAELLPDFDRNKMYITDIRKILSWYNLLITSGYTNFTPLEESEKTSQAGEEQTGEQVSE